MYIIVFDNCFFFELLLAMPHALVRSFAIVRSVLTESNLCGLKCIMHIVQLIHKLDAYILMIKYNFKCGYRTGANSGRECYLRGHF